MKHLPPKKNNHVVIAIPPTTDISNFVFEMILPKFFINFQKLSINLNLPQLFHHEVFLFFSQIVDYMHPMVEASVAVRYFSR